MSRTHARKCTGCLHNLAAQLKRKGSMSARDSSTAVDAKQAEAMDGELFCISQQVIRAAISLVCFAESFLLLRLLYMSSPPPSPPKFSLRSLNESHRFVQCCLRCQASSTLAWTVRRLLYASGSLRVELTRRRLPWLCEICGLTLRQLALTSEWVINCYHEYRFHL